MERRGGMRHSQGKMEMALQVPLPRTGRRQRKVRRYKVYICRIVYIRGVIMLAIITETSKQRVTIKNKCVAY